MLLVLRRIVHRVITYTLLTPVILTYMLTRDTRALDLFYSIRSIPHGVPLRNGLRLAKYQGIKCVFPFREDPFVDDVFQRDVYYPYKPRATDVVIDVGASVGSFTVKVAKQVREVIAFEPDPYNFSFLLTNLRINKLLNVRAFNYALGDREGYSFLKRGYGYGRTRLSESKCGVRCAVKQLDSVVKELGISPTAIKIDTEGWEMKVLKGAMATMTRCMPKLIIACYHYPNESEEVIKYLTGIGFRCFIYQVPLVLQKVKETYVYAVPKDNRLTGNFENGCV